MAKLGYVSVILAFIIIMGYSMFLVFGDINVSVIFKIALVIMFLGIGLIIFKQIVDRKKEKKEEDEYDKY